MATFQHRCEQCGTAFETPRRQARFCSSTCRSRNHRGKPAIAAVPDLTADTKKSRGKKAKAQTTESTPVDPAPTYDTLEEQLRASLGEINALETIAGMAAVRIAQQIDRGNDSGSAVVALSKELSRLRAEAIVEAAPKNRDGVDDIVDRVNDKLRLIVS